LIRELTPPKSPATPCSSGGVTPNCSANSSSPQPRKLGLPPPSNKPPAKDAASLLNMNRQPTTPRAAPWRYAVYHHLVGNALVRDRGRQQSSSTATGDARMRARQPNQCAPDAVRFAGGPRTHASGNTAPITLFPIRRSWTNPVNREQHYTVQSNP